MTCSYSDFTDTILNALGIEVPRKDADDPAGQTNLTIEKIESLKTRPGMDDEAFGAGFMRRVKAQRVTQAQVLEWLHDAGDTCPEFAAKAVTDEETEVDGKPPYSLPLHHPLSPREVCDGVGAEVVLLLQRRMHEMRR